MAKNKMIKKNCPFCRLQVAVASKTCPGCKHAFYHTKRTSAAIIASAGAAAAEESLSRRRTERVKREKPNYYDASEFEKKTKKKRLERNNVGQTSTRGRPPNSVQGLKTKQKKKKKNKVTKENMDDDDSAVVVLSPEKFLQCSIILAEINRKFCSTTWRG